MINKCFTLKKLCFALIFLTVLITYGQTEKTSDSTEVISLSFDNSTIQSVLSSIEAKTDYTFFYLDSWFSDDLVSGDYTNVKTSKILEDIFKETALNFYVLTNEKIILTKNNIIYDQLPNGFFKENETVQEIAVAVSNAQPLNPVFYSSYRISGSVKLETVRIGKANKESNRPSYLLQGYVRKKNGDPIPDLSILVKGKGLGTVTDANGYFRINLPTGQNILIARAMGIQDVEREVIIYNNGSLDFELTESLELLDEVVVEAEAARNVEQAITGSTQIDTEESKNIPLVLGERDILQIATTLPGITTAGEGASGFNVRGGKTDQNLILLDNAVVYNPSHFFGIFQALNPFTTKGVNIYKGNIPAEYGGRLSSVFDIVTKDSNIEKFSGEASIGPVTSNLALEIPLTKDKSSLMFGARGAYSDWILRSLDDESLNNSTASFYDGIVKYNTKVNENNDVRATGYYSRDAFSITSDSLYNYSNRGFSLRWDRKFNEKNTGSFIIANSQYRFNIDFDGQANNDFGLGYK
ncbi:MAG: carboxypeptidase-like regulatory domain-containing protein, partial [Maribacter sp.]